MALYSYSHTQDFVLVLILGSLYSHYKSALWTVHMLLEVLKYFLVGSWRLFSGPPEWHNPNNHEVWIKMGSSINRKMRRKSLIVINFCDESVILHVLEGACVLTKIDLHVPQYLTISVCVNILCKCICIPISPNFTGLTISAVHQHWY